MVLDAGGRFAFKARNKWVAKRGYDAAIKRESRADIWDIGAKLAFKAWNDSCSGGRCCGGCGPISPLAKDTEARGKFEAGAEMWDIWDVGAKWAFKAWKDCCNRR